MRLASFFVTDPKQKLTMAVSRTWNLPRTSGGTTVSASESVVGISAATAGPGLALTRKGGVSQLGRLRLEDQAALAQTWLCGARHLRLRSHQDQQGVL